MFILLNEETGQKFPLSIDTLMGIASDAALNIQSQRELFDALFATRNPSIIKSMTHNLRFEHISDAQVDTIWDVLSQEERSDLVGSMDFMERMSSKHLAEIIAANEHAPIEQLAYHMDFQNPPRRLSKKDMQNLFAHLKNHPCITIRRAFATNHMLPKRKPFTLDECISMGCLPDYFVEALDVCSVKKLEKAPSDIMETLVSSLDEIKDEEAQNEAVNLILRHPNPYHAQEAAGRYGLPDNIMKKFCASSDPVVRKISQENMKANHSEE